MIMSTSDIKPWKTLSSEVVLETPTYKLRKDTCLLPDGIIIHDYFVREEQDIVFIFCVTTGNEVVLVRQYRQGIGQTTLELPAGYMSRHDHSLEDGARRELLEETGYGADKCEQWVRWCVSSGTSTNHMVLFYAPAATKIGVPQHTSREFTETFLVPLTEISALLERGEVVDGKHNAAILYTLRKLNVA